MYIVDAHQHCWDLEQVPLPWPTPEDGPLYRGYGWEDLAPLLAETGVDATVLVQAGDCREDTEFLLDLAGRHTEVAGVVGWVPLENADDAERMLMEHRQHPKFVGVRALIHTMPDRDWLLRADVNDGLTVLERHHIPYDVVSVLPSELRHIPELSARHPDLRMVIDHLSKPPIGFDDWEPWRTLMRHAAENPNVFAKVSGLYPASGSLEAWDADTLRPFVHEALEVFGAGRLMFGSDWPVAVLAGGYVKVWEELNRVFAELSDLEREAILGGTAVAFYELPAERL